MAAVFVWGFTIDVSVDALVDVMSKGLEKAQDGAPPDTGAVK